MKQPLAYIHPDAKIDPSVVIDPFVTIDRNVEIGAGSVITHSIPDNAVVYGEASRVRKIKEE